MLDFFSSYFLPLFSFAHYFFSSLHNVAYPERKDWGMMVCVCRGNGNPKEAVIAGNYSFWNAFPFPFDNGSGFFFYLADPGGFQIDESTLGAVSTW